MTAPMLISRRLAHKVHSKLQVIMGLVELQRSADAVTAIHELADFLNSHVESREAEREREHSQDADSH